MVLEGRHGNSIRIGSRNIHPYIIISNGRAPLNPVETSLDGTILAILENGSIRDHFIVHGDDQTSFNYNFTLADDEITEVYKSISKTFKKSLGHGGNEVVKSELKSGNLFDVEDVIYNYNGNQLFTSSDRITFNARKESMFLSALEHIHIGCGSSMTFSTSKNILTEAHQSVITNTNGRFEVNASTVYIDGREKIALGNSVLDDLMEKAVLGNSLVGQLSKMFHLMKEMCYITSAAIENRSLPGGSLKTMREVVDAIDDELGMERDENDKLYPKRVSDLILSNNVFLKRGPVIPGE